MFNKLAITLSVIITELCLDFWNAYLILFQVTYDCSKEKVKPDFFLWSHFFYKNWYFNFFNFLVKHSSNTFLLWQKVWSYDEK